MPKKEAIKHSKKLQIKNETIKCVYPFNDLIYENFGVDALSKLKNLRTNELINQANSLHRFFAHSSHAFGVLQ